MNIFANAERTVQSAYRAQKTTPLNVMSDTASSNSKLRQLAEEQECMESAQRIADIDKEYSRKKMMESVVNKTLYESRIENKIGRLSVIGRDAIFKDILFETFYNALLMDESFLRENKSTIEGLIIKYVDDNGGYSLLKESADVTKSELLRRMGTRIDSLVREVCSRKIKECNSNEDVDNLDFDLDEEEQKKLTSIKDDLSIADISELVKSKVLDVVQDEKKRQDQEAEIVNEIEEDLKDNENVTDEKSLNEALQKIIINKSPVEDATLFNALFRSSYHEALAENVAVTTAAREDDDFDDNHIGNQSDIDSTADDDDTHVDDFNLDELMVEAITKYTLMETLYTLKLETYTHGNLRKLIHKLVNV